MKKNIISALCASLLIALPACMCDKDKSCCNKSTHCETKSEVVTPAGTESPIETAVETEHVHTDKDQTEKF